MACGNGGGSGGGGGNGGGGGVKVGVAKLRRISAPARLKVTLPIQGWYRDEKSGVLGLSGSRLPDQSAPKFELKRCRIYVPERQCSSVVSRFWLSPDVVRLERLQQVHRELRSWSQKASGTESRISML